MANGSVQLGGSPSSGEYGNVEPLTSMLTISCLLNLALSPGDDSYSESKILHDRFGSLTHTCAVYLTRRVGESNPALQRRFAGQLVLALECKDIRGRKGSVSVLALERPRHGSALFVPGKAIFAGGVPDIVLVADTDYLAGVSA